MSEQTTRGRAQDRARVAGAQKHETSYEAKKTGTSPKEVRQRGQGGRQLAAKGGTATRRAQRTEAGADDLKGRRSSLRRQVAR